MRDDFLGAWQQFGELMGMPAERMAATIERLMFQQTHMTTEEGYARLLSEAGFRRVARFFSVMDAGMAAWIAR